ncbi:MAG: METTL5 family protein [Methanomassiliicoccales archaeon]
MRKKELEFKLQELKTYTNPKPSLEQYTTPADIASSMIYEAALAGDITGRKVADLGCGVGTLSIGAALMGAAMVWGFDYDREAIQIARENASKILGVENQGRILFQEKDIAEVEGDFDTVVQNPPFGAQSRNADIPFIRKAAELADVIYTLYPESNASFMDRLAADAGLKVAIKSRFMYRMKRQFEFHTHKEITFGLILYKLTAIQ